VIRLTTLFIAFLLMMPSAFLQGQNEKPVSVPANDVGPDSETLELIQRKWLGAQPAIIVVSEDGKQISGQPLHAGIDTLYLFASTSLPVGPDQNKKVHAIPFVHVDRVLIQKGGNLITRSRKSSGHQIPVENKYFTKGFQALIKAAVYPDTMLIPSTMEKAFEHSPVFRQVFPHKHFRISVSAGFGGDAGLNDAREALLYSSLPSPEDGYNNVASIDILDVSWRFLDRYIIGGQLLARNASSTLYAYSQGEDWSNYFSYYVNYFEHRFYAEYVFFPVDRYFTKRWEFTAGAGLLIGKPEWTLFYNHDEYSDPDNPVYGTVTHTQTDPLLGFQLRAAFHLYLIPGFSLWSGLEGNFNSPWVIQQVEVPSNNPSVSLVLQEHTLNFSSVRFKLGVSIYL